MKKHFILVNILLSLSCFASAQMVSTGYTRKPEIKLNETRIRKSSFEYVKSPKIIEASKLCAQGKWDECISGLAKISSSGEGNLISAEAETELAFVHLSLGNLQKALEHIDAAQMFDSENPFIFLAKSWILVSMGKYKESKEELERMLYLTADFEYVYSARLANAIAGMISKDGKSQEQFAYIYSTNPYLIGLSAYMIALESFNKGGKKNIQTAEIFAEQALTHDSSNFPAARLLAEIKYQQKDYDSAWKYYGSVYGKDVTDKKAAKRIKKLSKKEIKNRDLFITKLDKPIVRSYEQTPSSQQLRIALFADKKLSPVKLQSFEIVSSGGLTVYDEKLGEVFKSGAGIVETISFIPQTGGLIIKDSYGNTKFATKRNISLVPEKGRTILVKNPKGKDLYEADFSDRELKGVIEVNPSEEGMLIVNTAVLEDVLPALMAQGASSMTRRTEAMKAFAIVLRSRLANAIFSRADEHYHITDMEEGMQFLGVNMQSDEAVKAVEATRHVYITDSSVDFYSSCFIFNEEGISNSASAKKFAYTPSNIFRYIISNPPLDLLSAPQDATEWAGIKWAYYYDVADIQRRANSIKKIGNITGIEVSSVSDKGRVNHLTIKGKKDNLEIKDYGLITYVLGAGSTRSNSFVVIPFYKGKKFKNILLLGVDTGKGSGFCLAGAEGLEKKGETYLNILKYYYPGSGLVADTAPAEKVSSPNGNKTINEE
ncbi:Sporulation protein-like protein [Elusimicrobium minutum Pei191]|uniref:Sporulation protein-like protein n=1 Tax=Elusimicrobium minutum (strain Pei191) TaxID=445932 RepID=B2KCC1_ELUMP|nr:SpoIID/LytB domain-containing protein [Elusimicrobium minutum]ACC98042.1 Sporulation protein-like protein [Elusimicrobium minutum Pei191]